MKERSYLKAIVLLVFFVPITSAKAQQVGSAFADGNKIINIKMGASSYKLQFPISNNEIKSAFMPKAKRFQYIVDLQFGTDQCDRKSILNWQNMHEGASLASFVNSEAGFEFELGGDDVNSSIEREAERCGWNDGNVVFALLVPNKSGKPMVISEVILKVESDARQQSLAGNRGEILKLFQSGLAANKVNDKALASAVEDYMESKWPSEDITTVHITDRQYQNTQNTAFKLNGYYITQKGGACKYNSFYGDGQRTSNGYNITFFNSMNAETTMDCGAASELRNM